MSTQNDDQEKSGGRQEHAQLMTELPEAGGWWHPQIFLYRGYWLSPGALLGAIRMQNQDRFKPRSTDIFLSAAMKSGTTWLRSLMFSTLNRSKYDFSDHPLLRKGPHECFPQLEANLSEYGLRCHLEGLPSPRIFASHLAHSMFPTSITDPGSGCKFVYVCRDPKDVLVSKFHFLKRLRSPDRPPLSFDQAFESFCNGVSEYGPYWDHVLGFWKASLESPDKILFLKYEDMKREPKSHVKRLAEFMGVPFSVDEEENGVVEKIVEFCSFDHMKNLDVNKTGFILLKNAAELHNNLFFRKGQVGDWENHLTQAMSDRIDQITRDKFNGSGLIIGATRN